MCHIIDTGLDQAHNCDGPVTCFDINRKCTAFITHLTQHIFRSMNILVGWVENSKMPAARNLGLPPVSESARPGQS
jgi:hypothetical protein